jgi:N-acyl-D-amino-acid deacylase
VRAWPKRWWAIVGIAVGCGRPSAGAVASASASAGASGSASAGAGASASASAGASTSASAKVATPPAWANGAAWAGGETFDLIITGGTIVDGTGAAATPGDVVIDGGRIVHVGKIDASVRAKKRIDATGLVVTPGFIDMHAHGDPAGASRNFLAMGVTTLCVGQDGKSAEGDRVADFARRLGKKRLAVNIVPFAGHGTARELTGVGLAAKPTLAQLDKLTRFVAREMEAGAFGLTTGLEYRPGALAPKEELVALAKPVAASDGVIMSHMRSEDDDKIDAALDELLAQGGTDLARVHVSHIKVVYGKGEARAERLLAKIDEARARGVTITADIYPYEASYTTIGIVFPDFAKPPHDYKRVARERHDDLVKFLGERIAARGGPSATLFGSEPYRGKTLEQVAKAAGKSFEDVLVRIGPNGASAAYFVMDAALQARLLVDSHVMIGTDGSSSSQHPRGYGTFAKVIRQFVVEEKRLTLEEAVHKMTGLPATTLRLDKQKRGLLADDWAADLCIFDPREVKDRASYTDPNALAEGMRWVLVNGVPEIAAGKFEKSRGGRLLLMKR